MKRTYYRLTLCTLTALTLAGCSAIDGMFTSEEDPLGGERISVLELQQSLEPDSAALQGEPLTAPSAWQNEFWPQAGGYPNHAMQHLALADPNMVYKSCAVHKYAILDI